MNDAYFLIVYGLLFLFALSVGYAWWWAVRNRQFSRLREGARSIFDGDEPIGRVTDTFPTGEEAVSSRAKREGPA